MFDIYSTFFIYFYNPSKCLQTESCNTKGGRNIVFFTAQEKMPKNCTDQGISLTADLRQNKKKLQACKFRLGNHQDILRNHIR